jgi:hypothetical protein
MVGRVEVSPKARKRGHDGRVVEIGANRQSCGPSTLLLFKLVLEVVVGAAGCFCNRDNPHLERSSPHKRGDGVQRHGRDHRRFMERNYRDDSVNE